MWVFEHFVWQCPGPWPTWKSSELSMVTSWWCVYVCVCVCVCVRVLACPYMLSCMLVVVEEAIFQSSGCWATKRQAMGLCNLLSAESFFNTKSQSHLIIWDGSKVITGTKPCIFNVWRQDWLSFGLLPWDLNSAMGLFSSRVAFLRRRLHLSEGKSSKAKAGNEGSLALSFREKTQGSVYSSVDKSSWHEL